MSFRDRFKALRIKSGLTQKELAEKSGVSYSYVTKLESGEANNPTYEILEALGTVLQAPLGAIYDFADVVDELSPKSFKQIKPSASNLDPQSTKCLNLFGRLNKTGKQKALENLEDLTNIPKYTEKEKTYQVKIAARNGKFEERIMTESEINEIKNYPDVDDLE